MLRICKFYFPNIIHLRNVGFDYSGKKKELELYKLDWSYQERKLKEEHEKWLKSCQPGKDVPFINPLPESIDKWVKELRFAISSSYMKEINRCSLKLVEEYSISRPFDTIIRDMCLCPAHKFVNVAFKLLADCIFDEEKKYWSHSIRKWLAPHAMIYKFWAYQTGRGLIWWFAEMDRLEKQIKRTNVWKPEEIQEIKDFLGQIKKQNEIYVESYKLIYEVMLAEGVKNDSKRIN